MVFIDFKICLPTKKKIKPNRAPKQPKSNVYTIKKQPTKTLKHLIQANWNKRLYFRVFESESTLFEPKNFIPDNQDPIFAGYGYNLHVNFIHVWIHFHCIKEKMY